MRIETRMNGTTFEAKLGDRMVFSDSGAFRSLLQQVEGAKANACVLDLSGLASIDSAGLGMFMIALDAAKKGGWSLRLRSPRGQVKSLLELGKFDQLLAIEPSPGRGSRCTGPATAAAARRRRARIRATLSRTPESW